MINYFKMRNYSILDLIPLEDFIRTSSLRFLTQVWRNLGSFDTIRNPAYLREINGFLYAEDGNHRCVWKLINGIYTINAELEKTDDETARITLLTANSVRKRGVHKFEDLVKMVKNPEQFTITGPIIHRITMEDLQSPDYFLKI